VNAGPAAEDRRYPVAVLQARAPYLVWLISLATVAVSVISLPGAACVSRIR